jgi:signal transduction histidine kinase
MESSAATVARPRVDGRTAQSALAWDLSALAPLRRAAFLGLFVVAYGLLTYAGYELKENFLALTIIWPAAGLLFAALYLMPVRQWVWLIPLQLATEVVVGQIRATNTGLDWSLLFPVANLVDATTGALLAKRLISDASLPRVPVVVRLVGAWAFGAAVGALVGAIGAVRALEDATYLNQWQLWWAGNWLGALAVAPVAITWTARWRAPARAVVPVRAVECAMLAVVLLGATAWIFSVPSGSPASLLHLPFLLIAILVVIAFRVPPRWAVTLGAGATLLAAAFASRGLGPFSGDPSAFGRVVALQMYLATIAVFTFMLSTVLLEKRRTLEALALGAERYRNFVARSSEAVWRVELAQPMPVDLPVAAQVEWFERHAYIAECNRQYENLCVRQGGSGSDSRHWLADLPWSATFLERLEEAARREFSMDGLHFAMRSGARQEQWLASFSGVVEDGKLVRVWGVARDITELVQLNERLRREQQRLQAYARELTGAEERARRATAVDLHDGIGQMLAGLGMTIDAAGSQSPPGVRQLLDEMRSTVREVQETTRKVIADLSPPGLYELGLGPALQWLALYSRGKDGLEVELELSFDEQALDLELRVLVFKVVRELLRNVVKHARVLAARVVVTATDERLYLEVRDHGVGFEWQLDLFGGEMHGFGLWSIADRVRVAHGEFAVETAPGKGCSVRLVFPLPGASRPGTQEMLAG